MTEQIKEEISNYNPRYIFSSPTREGDKFWFKATKYNKRQCLAHIMIAKSTAFCYF